MSDERRFVVVDKYDRPTGGLFRRQFDAEGYARGMDQEKFLDTPHRILECVDLAELERLRKDAERYRWLRDESDCDAEQPYVVITKTGDWGKSYDELPISEQLDAAIDAAMTKEPRDGR